MNRETFDILMLDEGWKCIGKPDVANEMSCDQNVDWESRAKQIQYQRGMCLIFTTDEEIEQFNDESFIKWFIKKSSGYYFRDDWKKAFKGSEFLIPVVEKELEQRKKSNMDDALRNLFMIQRGNLTIDTAIDDIVKYLKTEQ